MNSAGVTFILAGCQVCYTRCGEILRCTKYLLRECVFAQHGLQVQICYLYAWCHISKHVRIECCMDLLVFLQKKKTFIQEAPFCSFCHLGSMHSIIIWTRNMLCMTHLRRESHIRSLALNAWLRPIHEIWFHFAWAVMCGPSDLGWNGWQNTR